MIKSQEENKPGKPPRRVILYESDEDMDQTEEDEEEFQDLVEDLDQTEFEEDDIPVTGESLATFVKEAVDCLSTLYSSKMAVTPV